MPTLLTLRHGSATEPAIPHVVLVGLPGAGKSTVGEAVASALGRAFLDLDEEIERRQGKTIPQIFAEHGEWRFRELERAVTSELADVGGIIVSPGGGWITNPETVALIRPPAGLVYLKARAATALARLGSARATRPLLARADPLAELDRLLELRRPAYLTADAVVDTDLLPYEAVIQKVSEFASQWGSRMFSPDSP